MAQQQPTGQQVFLDAATYNQLVQQGLITPGQPTQQIFQQPSTPPPPASTMQAMAQQGGWTQQGNPTVVNPVNQQQHAQAMPQQPQMTAQHQPQTATNPQIQQQVGQFMEQLKEGMMDMFGNGNGQQQGQQQQQPQGPEFFDTTWGKVTIGAGGIGVGVVGTKLIGSIFGSDKCAVSASDANAFVNAFKTLLK